MAALKYFVSLKALVFFVICGTMYGLSYGGSGTDKKDISIVKPGLHHILFEVRDIKKSLRFYRDCLGLVLTSQTGDFATLESENSGIYLWEKHWGWEKVSSKGERNGAGVYLHFNVSDIVAAVDRFKTAGYVIIQEPIIYDWGTEAFVQDPDGYIIALVTITKTK